MEEGRPRLIWSPHPTLKYTMGVVNKLWLATFKSNKWFTACDTPEEILGKISRASSNYNDPQYITIDGSSFDST